MTELPHDRPAPVCGLDTWVPLPARLLEIRRENLNTRTYRLQLTDPGLRDLYRWQPGQFNMLYVPGVGEAAISISSDGRDPTVIDHTIKIVGSVTQAIDRMEVGATIGLRGPFGRGWPLEQIDGHDVVLVAGGIGLAPVRPVVHWLLRNRERVRRLILLYGCRTPDDRVFAEELDAWDADDAVDAIVTVDNATPDWSGPVGVVTNLLRRVRVKAEQTLVMVCGPKMLNRAAVWKFLELHVPPSQVYLALERNMNCGFGLCGHCQLGGKFVCRDGPVFAYPEIAEAFTVEEL